MVMDGEDVDQTGDCHDNGGQQDKGGQDWDGDDGVERDTRRSVEGFGCRGDGWGGAICFYYSQKEFLRVAIIEVTAYSEFEGILTYDLDIIITVSIKLKIKKIKKNYFSKCLFFNKCFHYNNYTLDILTEVFHH